MTLLARRLHLCPLVPASAQLTVGRCVLRPVAVPVRTGRYVCGSVPGPRRGVTCSARWRQPDPLPTPPSRRRRSCPTSEEPDPLRHVRLAHLHDRPLRDLLLPGDRAAPRAGGRLRRERVPADQRGPEARSRVQGPADPLQDAQRVRAGERHPRRGPGRRRRLRRTDAEPDAAADRRAAGPALRADHPRADAHLRVRHHPAVADPAERPAVGRRRAVRLRARHLGARST